MNALLFALALGADPSGVPPGTPDALRYVPAYQKALAEKKSLVVWLGYACPPCEAATRDCVHVHLENYAAWGFAKPGVIVGRYQATYTNPPRGELWRVDLKDDCSLARIKATLYPWLAPSFTNGSPCGPSGCGVPFGGVR